MARDANRSRTRRGGRGSIAVGACLGAAAAAILAVAGCATQPGQPENIVRSYPPTQVQGVKVYFASCRPAHYDNVAKLDASKLGLFSSYGFNLRWLRSLRDQAAGLGADGVLLIPLGSVATFGAEEHGPGFRALAIRLAATPAPTPGTALWAAHCEKAARQLDYRVFHRSTGLAGKRGGG